MAIFIGIHGDVIALDRGTGEQLWKTNLKGGDFVNVLLDGDRVLAATKGEIFCLDAATGQVLWHNELPGAGWGVVTIATASGSSSPLPPIREKQRRDEAASTAAVVAST
jgi:outer membrane protein assembly factor BamB